LQNKCSKKQILYAKVKFWNNSNSMWQKKKSLWKIKNVCSFQRYTTWRIVLKSQYKAKKNRMGFRHIAYKAI
jgi:hypothetical protein